MPRAKKRKDTPPVTEAKADSASIEAVAVDAVPAAAPISELSQPGMSPPDDQPEAKTPRGQFRSWVVDTKRGYVRMTDNLHNRIVLQFAAKPPAEMLTAIKAAGFEFKADYYGQQNVWVRRNDFEGRVQAEAIEKQLRVESDGRESAGRGG